MTDILGMTPEEFEDAQTAASLHDLQTFVDMSFAAEYGMSPNGFKNPDRMIKSRYNERKKLIEKKNALLGVGQAVQDPDKIAKDRAKLKGGFVL